MAEERLESWKEIAAYLKRDESTVRRWERSEGLPVHRHQHQARSRVYAYPAELDAWREARRAPGAGSHVDRPSDFPVISPDARRIAFAWHIQDTDTTELRVVPVDQATPPVVRVRNPEFGYLIPVAWLPDGQSLLTLAARKVDRTWQLSRVAVEDGRIEQLRSLGWRVPTPIDHAVSVSPDGRYIAYEALPANPPQPVSARSPAVDRHIYVMAADGSGTETVIAEGAASNHGPAWTPDGRFVVYPSNVSGTVDAWAVPMREGKAAGPVRLVRKSFGRPERSES